MAAYEQIVRELFATGAFRVAEADHPFWYTSGKFGPYFINTHFLFGGEEHAKALLESIDYTGKYPLALPRVIGRRCSEEYEQDPRYRAVIDSLREMAADLSYDLVSGGERRDFFFSYAFAEASGKSHLSIMKDGSAYLSSPGLKDTHEVKKDELSGLRVLHVADLVTEASSYFRAWIPAIHQAGASISDTIAVVDRQQGGREALLEHDVRLHAPIVIHPDFFHTAAQLGQIDAAQEAALQRFFEDPDGYMQHFLDTHPAFLEAESQRDAKTAERVERLRQILARQELEKDKH